MASIPPATPRHGTRRASHLRQVSHDSSGSNRNSRPSTRASDTDTTQYEPLFQKAPVERRCILWVHEESFSKDEIVLNLDLFPGIKPGELMAIVPLQTDTRARDSKEMAQGPKSDADNLSTAMQRDRSTSNPISLNQDNATDIRRDIDPEKRYLFIAQDMGTEMKSRHPTLEVSAAKHIADMFYFKHRSNVFLTTVDVASCSASHVELSFKDEYLARSDMWRLAVSELSNKTVFRGQKILFLGTIRANVTSVYVGGQKVRSAFSSADTKPVFRSESARYVLFIQMSKEMWDFDSEGSGEIMFNKVINGFLPSLFKKWATLRVKHLVSIILFTRVEYDSGLTSELAADVHDSTYHTGVQTDGNKKPYKDFYRVVVSEMASGSWTTILYQLKREFKFFRRDISMHRIDTASGLTSGLPESHFKGVPGTRIEAQPSLAMYGNVLEAINLASSHFSHDYIDRDLMRTGISIVVITPCPGVFEVDYETLRMTTEVLIGNGIAIDLVCLPKMPLHSVPVFRYRNPQYATFQERLHLKSLRSEDNTPRQNATVLGASFSSLKDSFSPTKPSLSDRSLHHGVAQATCPSEWNYAIPHWLDVSFWTGELRNISLTNPILGISPNHPKRSGTRDSKNFPVRCKMYEMEMASVMENVMTEISVKPLQRDTILSQMMAKSRGEPKNQLSQNGLCSFVPREKPYASLSEVVNGPSRPLWDRNSGQDEKPFYKTLAAFDLAVSEVMEGVSKARQRIDNSRNIRTDNDEALGHRLAAERKLFSTSFDDENGNHKGTSIARTRAASPNNGGASGGAHKARKDSVSSTITAKLKVSPRKAPKFGRQISLGKHGFGIAAPKAATAELQTKHVNAARPSTSAVDPSEAKKATSNTMANRLLGTTSDRPSSSQSGKSKTRSDTSPSGTRTTTEAASKPKVSIPPSKPITIRSAVQNLDATNQFNSRSVLGSVHEGLNHLSDPEEAHTLQSLTRPNDTRKIYTSKLLAGSVAELPATLSPTTALSPWLSLLNPSNPSSNATTVPSQYRRWQHAFAKPIQAKTIKWKSLCTPASVPLTTEYFPTKRQLDTEYQQMPYSISQNFDDDNEISEVPRGREELLRELISLRLSQGFQIVVGPAVAEAFGQKSMRITNVFNQDRIAEDGASIFMSMGNIIHQLSCVNGTEIEVNMLVRKPTAPTASTSGTAGPTTFVYNPAIRTTLSEYYEARQITLGRPRGEYNWNYVDTYIAGSAEEMSENLRFWRARFVLIPVERPTQYQRRQGEDSEEEIRLEGIKKLTQIWQRHRIITASERRFQSLTTRKAKHPNPLDIVYKTEDPSVVVTAELETLPLVESGDGPTRRGQLLESERFRKEKFDIAELAEAIQSPIEKGGVRMQNRRWHFRLHHNCFIGSDMTTWLIENFEDIETRAEAIELGNMLMTKERDRDGSKENVKDKDKDMGIFVHVEKRHAFRDGQYFYQVTGEFAKQRPESRGGWFGSRRRDTSTPPTPMSDTTKDSPRPERSWSGSTNDDRSSDSGTATPVTTGGSGKRPKVALSNIMRYDVDHRKRSYRPERINLHYDRLHNPDNCYHIRIDWMSVTAKLIEDAVESWASTAERYGLRLIEAPIGEACSITSVHPFRSPYSVNLAIQPPDRRPPTYFDPTTFTSQVQPNPASHHYYHKAIMKKFNFVLDTEAAHNFPSNVDVTYSWGKPDFKYTQYIHRSGVVLAQIKNDGNFLLVANQLYNSRTAAIKDSERYARTDHVEHTDGGARISHLATERPTPISSPLLRPTPPTFQSPMLKATSDVLGPSLSNSKLVNAITPESVKNDLEAFCRDAAALETFYTEVYERGIHPSATPPSHLRSPLVTGLGDVPPFGLPPGLFARDPSPTPLRLSGVGGVGSPLPMMGRRQSVQLSALPLAQSVDGSLPSDGRRAGTAASPRAGCADGEKAL